MGRSLKLVIVTNTDTWSAQDETVPAAARGAQAVVPAAVSSRLHEARRMRPLFVAEQLELVLTEGLPVRLRLARARLARARSTEQQFVKLDEWMRRLRPVLYGTIWWLFFVAPALASEVFDWFEGRFGSIVGGCLTMFVVAAAVIGAVFAIQAVRDSAERAERRRASRKAVIRAAARA